MNRFCGEFAPLVPPFSLLDFRWTNGNHDAEPCCQRLLLCQRLARSCKYRSLRRVATLIDRFDSNNARFIAAYNPSGWKHITRRERWDDERRGNSNRRKSRRVLAPPLTLDDVSALQNSIMRWVRDKFEAREIPNGRFLHDFIARSRRSSSSSASCVVQIEIKVPEICKSIWLLTKTF